MEIALYRPEIPPNTGNIARLSVCTQSRLHIIGEPSFSMSDAAVRRAGLDYWHLVDLHRHSEWEQFLFYHEHRKQEIHAEQNIYLFTRFASRNYDEVSYNEHDVLLFGRESSGIADHISDDLKVRCPKNFLRIPVSSQTRSLNLANSVSIALYEALRQQNFLSLSRKPDSEKDKP